MATSTSWWASAGSSHIGDVLFGRLIDKADALKIGRKAGKLGPTLEAAFAAPLKRVRGLKLVDRERRDRELTEAATQEAELRGKLFDLPQLDALLMPPPAPLPPVPPESPAERHAKALGVLKRAVRLEATAKTKMKAYEDQMDQMGPEADWTKLSTVEEQLRACNGGELSAAARHQLNRLEQVLQRHDDAILEVDAHWKKAHAAWEDAWQVRRYAELESDGTERVLRGEGCGGGRGGG